MGLQGLTDEGTTDLELVSSLNEQFGKIGISLTDNSGQLRSSYDILHDLSDIWTTLDKNTQAYIAELVAGKNQVDVFNALLSNFESAVGANATAMDSAGSAARENAAYMESLEAKVSALKQSFQELSTSIVDNDLVKIILDMANGLLEIVNTPVGKFALVAGGITAVTVALVSMWDVLKIGKAFSTVFAGGAKTLAVGLGQLNVPLIAIIAGVGALIALFPTLKSWYDKFTMSLEDCNTQLNTTKDQLENNKKRLEEINGLSWGDKTEEILAEKDALVLENEELQKQIDKLEKLSKKKAEGILRSGGTVEGTKYKVSSLGDTYAGRFDSGIQQAEFETYNQLIQYLDNYIPSASMKTKEELEELGVVFEEVTGDVFLIGDAYQKALIEKAKTLTDTLKNEKSLTEDQIVEYREVTKALGEISEAHIALGQDTDESVTVVKELTGAYDEATNFISDYVQGLVDTQTQAGKTGKELYNLVAAQIAANNAKLNFTQQLQALKQLAVMAGVTSEVINSVGSDANVGAGYRFYTNTRTRNGKVVEGKSIEEAQALMIGRMWDDMLGSIVEPTVVNPAGNGTGTGGKSSTTEKDPIEEQSKLFKDQISVLENRLSILQKSNATQEEQVAQMKKIQDALHEQAEWYRAQGLDDNSQYLSELGNQWWDYQNKIQDVYDAIAKAAEEARQKELESQKNAYEALFSYMSDKIDDRISDLQEQRSEEEDYWDAKIQALKDENDEIERQIELETLQSNLAKANQSQVMVFKDGRFQYTKNIDEISQAQTALESYQREQALADETARLETLKNKALASIDKQIKGWEDYKDEWSSVVEDYSNKQDELLIEQQLGIKLEGDNWQERIKNLADYVSQYKSLMSSLSDLSSTSSEKKPTVGTPVKDSGSKTNIPSTPIPESKPSQDIKTVISQDIRKKKYATGTLSADGGMALVGEQGPELRVLNQGDGIIPSDITKNLMALGSNPYAVMGNAYRNLAGKNGGNTTYGFSIDKIELPNVNDPPSFVEGLKNYAYQYTTQRK